MKRQVEFTGILKGETEKAIAVEVKEVLEGYGYMTTLWFPKSQINYDITEQFVTISVPGWLMIKKFKDETEKFIEYGGLTEITRLTCKL